MLVVTTHNFMFKFFLFYKYPPLVKIPQTSTLTTLPKAIPAESMVPRNAPSSLFATSSFSSSSFVLSVVKEEDTNDGGFSISMSSFSISSERGEWWSEESVCGPSAMLHAALKPLVNPNKNTKRIGNESKEKTGGMRQPDRFTLHEASKGTNTIRYRLRRNATWPVTFCSPRL